MRRPGIVTQHRPAANPLLIHQPDCTGRNSPVWTDTGANLLFSGIGRHGTTPVGRPEEVFGSGGCRFESCPASKGVAVQRRAFVSTGPDTFRLFRDYCRVQATPPDLATRAFRASAGRTRNEPTVARPNGRGARSQRSEAPPFEPFGRRSGPGPTVGAQLSVIVSGGL